MTTEPMQRESADHGMTSGASLANEDDWSLVHELQSENQRLRDLVIYLSDIVIRNVVDRKPLRPPPLRNAPLA